MRTTYITIEQFISIFGTEGYSERFKNCKDKNGNICNGEYKVYDDTIFYTYIDKKGNLYDSSEIPNLDIKL